MHEDSSKFEKHWPVDSAEVNLLDFLDQRLQPFSRQRIKSLLALGCVWLTRRGSTQRVRRSKRVLEINDQVHVYYNEAILDQTVKAAELIADETQYSVWDKPSGMYSQGTRWGDANSICRWIETNAMTDRAVFQIHRLDRATSGLIIVAHTKKMASALTKLFEQRKVEKHYIAKVEGDFPSSFEGQTIDIPIDEKPAKTQVLEINYNRQNNTSTLKLNLLTGRKHQIRKHLAAKGFAILGDRLYGNVTDQDLLNNLDLQLRSCYLAFDCPISGEPKAYQI